MPVDKQVIIRYQALNRCFRNPYREFTIDDLVEECNKALRRADKPDVSKRTVQNDINILEADYGILLDEKLKRGRQRLCSLGDRCLGMTQTPVPMAIVMLGGKVLYRESDLQDILQRNYVPASRHIHR